MFKVITWPSNLHDSARSAEHQLAKSSQCYGKHIQIQNAELVLSQARIRKEAVKQNQKKGRKPFSHGQRGPVTKNHSAELLEKVRDVSFGFNIHLTSSNLSFPLMPFSLAVSSQNPEQAVFNWIRNNGFSDAKP